MPVSVQLQGVEAVLRQLRAIGQAVPAAAEEGCFKVAQRIAERAAAATPVDTGTLQKAWGAWKVKGGAAVGIKAGSERVALNKRGRLVYRDPASYVIYREFGTSRSAATPMLRPAVDAEAQAAPGVVAEVVEAAIARAAGGGK